MPLFIIENQELKDNMYDIPKDLEKHLRDTLQQYQGYGLTNAGTVSKGFKRLQGLVDPNFNKQDDNTSADGSRQISFSDMKRIDHDFRHMSKDPHDLQRVLNGGDKMATFVRDTLRKERTKVEPIAKKEMVKTRNKNAVKPSLKPTKPIEVGNVTANVHESVLKESLEDHPYWDMLNDYDAWYVFDCFSQNKDLWRPLIQPEMYQQALREFTKYGKFIKFPTKYIYQWMGIIMKNTAILRACTEICGHSNSVPVEEFIEFFFGGDEAMFEEYKESHNFDNDYDAMWEYLYEKGWDDYSKLPDGSDAISDYGIRPLEQIISEYNSDLEPEKVIVLINRLLDVVHCRGDIASMFIVGGSKTLSTISEEIKKKKTIFISEQQLNVLKEYRDQLQLPFQNSNITTNKYARPNYQHYIDWLESIGKYGKLPKSECDINYHYYKHFENAMIDWWDHECESYTPEELKDYYYSEWMEQHADELNNLFKLPPHEIQDYINNGYEDDLIGYWLNNYGSELWNNYLTERFEDKLDVYDFANNLTINDRGLIYIERMITIPNALEYNFSTYYKQNQDDLYQHLSKTYNGVGICWSWKENGANAYNGSEYTSSNETRIVLKGWIKCEDIDWEQTLVCNAWGLNDEKEIQTVTHKQVEIFEIMDVSHDVKIPLKKPIIVLT